MKKLIIFLLMVFIGIVSCVKDEDLKKATPKENENQTLLLNEIEGKGDPDYIELYNGSDAAIDLGGYKLHDKDPAEAYVIPAGTIISAGGFWTLDCDKDVYTKFKISSGGENVTLLDASGKIVDQLLEEDWPAGHAGLVGRVPDGGENWVVLSEESKGASNGK